MGRSLRNLARSVSKLQKPNPTFIKSEEAFPEGSRVLGNEKLQNKYRRLLYQSRKRGISECDLLLSTWLGKNGPQLSAEELDEYDGIINSEANEWDIFYWMSKTKPVPEEFDTPIMHSLQEHCANEKREERLKQPDLEEYKENTKLK